jgi:hypothetical protein
MKKIILICLLVNACAIESGRPQYDVCMEQENNLEFCEQFRVPKMQSKRVSGAEVIGMTAGLLIKPIF